MRTLQMPTTCRQMMDVFTICKALLPMNVTFSTVPIHRMRKSNTYLHNLQSYTFADTPLASVRMCGLSKKCATSALGDTFLASLTSPRSVLICDRSLSKPVMASVSSGSGSDVVGVGFGGPAFALPLPTKMIRAKTRWKR